MGYDLFYLSVDNDHRQVVNYFAAVKRAIYKMVMAIVAHTVRAR